jgi:adenosine deaminase
VAGIDLVGDEKFFDAEFYKPHFEKWSRYQKMVRVHVGEVGRVDNVKQALEQLKITNIAHGIDIIHDEELIKKAIDLDIQFDLALTSNLKIRPSLSMEAHPIHIMMDKGLKCTIGSDDPVVFATSLEDEYKLVNYPAQAILKSNAEEFTRKHGHL